MVIVCGIGRETGIKVQLTAPSDVVRMDLAHVRLAGKRFGLPGVYAFCYWNAGVNKLGGQCRI
jgi:hypothetical protein